MVKRLLTQVQIKKKRPLLVIKDLGEIFLDYDHIYPTKKLSSKKKADLMIQLSNYSPTPVKSNILQVSAPIGTTLPLSFQKCNYLKQLRWRTANPNTLVTLHPQLEDLLLGQQTINTLINQIRQENQVELSGRAKSYVTRRFNQRLTSLEELISTNQVSSFPLESQIIDQFHNLPQIAGCQFQLQKTGLEIVVRDLNLIDFHNHLPYSVAKSQKWLLLDIEKPLYGTPEEEISWITLCYLNQNQEIFRREVHTLRLPNLSEYLGYQIISHQSETDLLQGIIDSISEEDPDVISAYNAPYDLRNIQAAINQNKVPKDRFFPKIEVAKQFFERMRIDRRQVMDLLRYVQVRYHFLPDHKLETVAQFILGEKAFQKSIGYDEMRQLELRAKHQHDRAAADVICRYAVEDVKVMADLIGQLQIAETLTPICNHLSVELGRAVHNPDSVNNIQERKYFREVGSFLPQLDRAIPKFKKNREKLLKQVKWYKQDLLTESLSYQPQRGFHSQVSLCYIPWGDYLRSTLSERHNLTEFFSEKYLHFDNPEIQYTLSQYVDCLIESTLVDLMAWKNLRGELKETIPCFSLFEIEQMVQQTLTDLSRFSQWGKHNFKQGWLKEKTFLEYLPDPVRNKLEAKLVDPRQLYQAAMVYQKLQDRERFFLGHHGMDPNKVLEIINTQVANLTDFINHHDLNVVFQNGKEIYLQGETGKREPFFRVANNLDLLLTADLVPIYQLAGKYNRVKIKKKPLNYQCLFETHLLRDFLAPVFSGNFPAAESLVQERRQQLLSGQVPEKELLYWIRQRDVYSGFEAGSQRKTFFYLDRGPTEESLFDGKHHYEPLKEILDQDDLLNLTLFPTPESKPPGNCYYFQIGDFRPNLDEYHQKIFGRKSKISNMLLVLPKSI